MPFHSKQIRLFFKTTSDFKKYGYRLLIRTDSQASV